MTSKEKVIAMEKVEILIDGIRMQLLNSAKRKLNSGIINMAKFEPSGFALARILLTSSLRENTEIAAPKSADFKEILEALGYVKGKHMKDPIQTLTINDVNFDMLEKQRQSLNKLIDTFNQCKISSPIKHDVEAISNMLNEWSDEISHKEQDDERKKN